MERKRRSPPDCSQRASKEDFKCGEIDGLRNTYSPREIQIFFQLRHGRHRRVARWLAEMV